MDYLSFLEQILRDEVVQFFVVLALLQILAQVFVNRKIAFWIALLSTSYLWVRYKDTTVLLKSWLLIALVVSVLLVAKTMPYPNVLLYVKGKKRCPECFEETHWKAKICPFCGHHFKTVEKAQKGS